MLRVRYLKVEYQTGSIVYWSDFKVHKMHLSALSAVFKEQPFEEHFLKKDNVRYSAILAEQSIGNQKASDHTQRSWPVSTGCSWQGQNDDSAGTLLCM